MTTLTERVYARDWIVDESRDQFHSRDQVTLLGGQGIIPSGRILGITTIVTSSITPVDDTGDTGNATATATIATGGQPLPGTYKLVFESATHFTVEDPAGKTLGPGVVGTPVTYEGVTITVTAGGTAMAAGDTMSVPLTSPASQVYKTWDPTASDGSEVISGILVDQHDTGTSGSPNVQATVLTRGATVATSYLSGGTGYTGTTNQLAALIAGLKALGIKTLISA